MTKRIRAGQLQVRQKFTTTLTKKSGIVEDIRKALDYDYRPILGPHVFLIGAGRKTLHPNVLVDTEV